MKLVASIALLMVVVPNEVETETVVGDMLRLIVLRDDQGHHSLISTSMKMAITSLTLNQVVRGPTAKDQDAHPHVDSILRLTSKALTHQWMVFLTMMNLLMEREDIDLKEGDEVVESAHQAMDMMTMSMTTEILTIVKWMAEGPQVVQGLVDVIVVTAEVHVEDARINR